MNVNSVCTDCDSAIKPAALGKTKKNEKADIAAAAAPPASARPADVLELRSDDASVKTYTPAVAIIPPPAPAEPSIIAAPDAQRSTAPAQPAPTSADGTTIYNQEDLDALLLAFGARNGEAHFNSQYDLNADGAVGFDDLNTLLSQFGQHAAPAPATSPPVAPAAPLIVSSAFTPASEPAAAPTPVVAASALATPAEVTPAPTVLPAAATEPAATPPSQTTDGGFRQEDLPGLLFAYGRREGENGFEARFDLNGDGLIGFDDLNSALSTIAPGAAQHASTLEALVNAFGLQQGQQGFNPKFDFDGDGHIGFSDLNHMLSDLFDPTDRS